MSEALKTCPSCGKPLDSLTRTRGPVDVVYDFTYSRASGKWRRVQLEVVPNAETWSTLRCGHCGYRLDLDLGWVTELMDGIDRKENDRA